MIKRYGWIILSGLFSLNLYGMATVGLEDNQTIPSACQTNLESQKEICLSTMNILRKNLLAVLGELYNQLDYWQKAQYRPFGYFIEKGPYQWLVGKKQNIDLNNNVELINYEIIRNAHYLGLINEFEHCLEMTKDSELAQQLNNSISLLNYILTFCEIDERIEQICSDTKSIQALLEEYQKSVKCYKKKAIKNYSNLQKPGHFQRHWIGYSLSCIGALVGLGYYLKNKDQIAQWIIDGRTATSNIYNDNIKKPIKNSLDIIYHKKEDKPLISPEDITIDEKILRKELFDYYKDNYPKYTKEQVADRVNKAVATNTVPEEIWIDYTEQIKNPTWNVLSPFGQVVRLILLAQFQPLKMRVNQGFQKIDQVFEANKLNFELVVALPVTALVTLAGYISYKGLQKAYNSFSPKKELLYKPIKHALITIETILNTHINKPLSYAVKGQMHYWHYQLFQAASLIPLSSRTKFTQDIEELDDTYLTTEQKLNTMQRMFRTYDFLK